MPTPNDEAVRVARIRLHLIVNLLAVALPKPLVRRLIGERGADPRESVRQLGEALRSLDFATLTPRQLRAVRAALDVVEGERAD